MSDENVWETPRGCLYGILLAVASLPFAAYQAWAEGFAFAKLWLWHVVPMGYPVVTWRAFAVLSLIIGVIRFSAPKQKDTRGDREKAMWVALSWALPWVALAVGWLFL